MILSTLVVGNSSLGDPAVPGSAQRACARADLIQNNIDATRAAFNLDDVNEVPYTATTDAEPGALREDASTTAQIRLMDPNVISPTFEQREANRRYWGFDEVLSVDRYEIDDELQDTVIGVRELRPDKFGLADRSWVDQHIIYTHGYGAAAAHGNRRNSDGEPSFLQSGVPGEGAFGEYEERVYFGRHSPDYSIVGAPEGADPQEFDYQQGSTDDEQGGEQVYNTFQGDGGREQLLQPAAVCDQVPRSEHRDLQLPQRRVADPLRPRPPAEGPRGRSVPVPGLPDVSGRGR